jgi:hypothetical protein
MSFIFISRVNGIDFIRRIGECCSCWVVGDIGATLDLTAIDDLLQVVSGDRLPCESAFRRHDQLPLGRDLAAAILEPW